MAAVGRMGRRKKSSWEVTDAQGQGSSEQTGSTELSYTNSVSSLGRSRGTDM